MDSANSKNKSVAKNECVQVVVRCRPMNRKELATSEHKQVVEVFPLRGVIEIQNQNELGNNKMFTYDAVYDKSSTQQNIYDEIARPLVSSVLEGFNCCVFAYGQTGTGKTFTMEGERKDERFKGIIPRAFEQIWSHINRAENQNFLVTAAYMEIYMEELRDLLKPNSKSLELREAEHCGVFVPNLHSVLCKNVDEMMDVMNQGNKNRTTGRTNMNEHSSRSHAIFMIKIEMCDLETNKVNVGKLNLIDLAGSERQSKTGATAERLKEASKINRALSSLGNVISALAENSPHIPYRDSKLTRLLQDSLGGNSKTIMIANIGPSEYNYNETLTTLRYAHRAKTIQNKPVKNEDPQDAKLKEYQDEITRLRLLISERQNREKTLPRKKRVKKTNIVRASGIMMSSDGKAVSVMGNKKQPVPEDDEEEEEEDEDEIDENENGDGDNNILALAEADAETKERLLREKEISQQLANKLKELEGQVVRGGRNILDTYSERQTELEKRLEEIAERKKREVEMQQQLELQEETTIEIRETLTSVQQEVELKTRKLKKCYAKYMALKQELIDTCDEHNRDRRELEMAQNELIKELKKQLLIIENFVPIEVKTRLYTQSRYDDEREEWTLNPISFTDTGVQRRPISIPTRRRPISEYALQLIKSSDLMSTTLQPSPTQSQQNLLLSTSFNDNSVRYKGENIISYELDMPLRTTHDYKNPKVSASLQAVLAEAMQTEDDIDVTGGQQSSYPATMRSRLDKIIKRNGTAGGEVIRQNGTTGGGGGGGGSVGSITNSNNVDLQNGRQNTVINNRIKSSIPDANKRMTSTIKKPTSAYPKSRGLVTK